jgi:predicted N-formylglutamate amidohydrolase
MTYRPYHIFGEDRPARWLVTCDHATNRVPPEMGGSLGIAPEDMARHIAYDVGAAGVALALAERLDAPCVMSDFSRLVIDPNRGEDDPTLVMRLYDGTIIPANRHITAEEIERRLDAYHRPYHSAVATLAARRPDTVILSIHSFTPQLRGRDPRPWHVGVLFGRDTRLTDPLLARLRAESDLVVGANEPYGGHLDGDAIDRHATIPGRPNALVEVRNDLIGTEAQQIAWAARLAPLLDAALADAKV